MSVFGKPPCQFSRGSCLSRTLKPNEHDDSWGIRREVDFHIRAAEHFFKLVADDFNNLLAGTEALQYFLAKRFSPDGVRELLDDFEIHIRFKKRHANFLQGLFDVDFS